MVTTLRQELWSALTLLAASAPLYFLATGLMDAGSNGQADHIAAFCLLSTAGTALAARLTGAVVLFGPSVSWAAFVAFTIYWGGGAQLQAALWLASLAGLALLTLGLTGLGRLPFVHAPAWLPPALAAATGLILVGTGLKYAGIVVDHPASLTDIGDVVGRGPAVLYAGLSATLIALARQWRHPYAIGLLGSAATALLLGLTPEYHPFVTPDFGLMPNLTGEALEAVSENGTYLFLAITVVIFETMALVWAHRHWYDFDDRETRRLLILTGVIWTISPLLGVPGVSIVPESAAGRLSGGARSKAGYGAALLLGLSLFFPLVMELAGKGYGIGGSVLLYPVPAGLLVASGLACLTSLRWISADRHEELIPAGLLCAVAVFSNSLATGIAAGILAWIVMATARQGWRGVHPVWYAAIAVWLVRYLI